MPHYLNNDKNNMITTQAKSTMLFFVPFLKVCTIHGKCSLSMVDFFLMLLRDSDNSNLEKAHYLNVRCLGTFCLPIFTKDAKLLMPKNISYCIPHGKHLHLHSLCFNCIFYYFNFQLYSL